MGGRTPVKVAMCDDEGRPLDGIALRCQFFALLETAPDRSSEKYTKGWMGQSFADKFDALGSAQKVELAARMKIIYAPSLAHRDIYKESYVYRDLRSEPHYTRCPTLEIENASNERAARLAVAGVRPCACTYVTDDFRCAPDMPDARFVDERATKVDGEVGLGRGLGERVHTLPLPATAFEGEQEKTIWT